MTRNMKTLWLAAAVALAVPSLTAMADGMGGMGMGGGYGHPGDMRGHDGCSDRHGRMDRHDRMERMADKLGLTDAQKKQMQALRDETRKTMQPLFEQKRDIMRQMWQLDPDARDYMDQVKRLAAKQADLTQQMIIAGAEARTKFRAVLTDEQKAKLKQMREERRKAYEDRSGHGMGDGHGHMGGM
ncbi:MAG TPA: Spy/CpxP family protein refolding chaperone [Mariprofundaceae bacterium]|nr:Spy/CpxP family protein refolding chaperone [Mariprofundaceae bacterium]